MPFLEVLRLVDRVVERTEDVRRPGRRDPDDALDEELRGRAFDVR